MPRGRALALSRDGKFLAAVGEKDVCLWDLDSGEVTPLGRPARLNLAAAFAADSKGVTSVGTEGLCVRRSTAGIEEPRQFRLKELPQGGDLLHTLAFSADGRTMAWVDCHDPDRIQVTDADTGDPLIRTTPRVELFLTFSPDGTRLVALCRDNVARVWETATGREQRAISCKRDRLSGLGFSSDGEAVVVAEEAVRAWDLAASGPKPRVLFVPENPQYFSPSFSADGRWLLSGELRFDRTDGGTKWRQVKLWDLKAEKATAEIDDLAAAPKTYTIAPGGKRLARLIDARTIGVQGLSGPCQTWDTGKEWCEGLAWADDKSLVGVLSSYSPRRPECRVVRWDVGGKEPGRPELLFRKECSGMILSVDGGCCACRAEAGGLEVWDVAAGKLLRRFETDAWGQDRLQFSPDGRLLATLEADGSVLIWGLPR